MKGSEMKKMPVVEIFGYAGAGHSDTIEHVLSSMPRLLVFSESWQ
jgi:hypothetical protein